MRAKLILISLLHVMIGIFLSLSHGIFYGDAINFYNYREFLDFHFDLNFIDLIQNINVGFVSLVYATPLQCFFVNILVLLILNNSISYFLSISASKPVNSAKNLKVFYILAALVILCPSVIARIGEPSREYMQNIFLFLAGVFLTISLKRFAFFLFIIVLIRPVMLPIYILWLGFVHIYRKKQRYVLLYVCLTTVSIVFALDEFSKFNFYSKKIIDYAGVLTENPLLIDKFILNIFGDVNSFFTDNYAHEERLLFLLDYLWRLIFIYYLIKFGKKFSLIFIIYGSILISLVYPFPHPRYFVPLLFFIAGLLASSNLQFLSKKSRLFFASGLNNKL